LRKHALLGLVLGCSGIIGLWSVGFFTMDLIRFVQRDPVTVQLYTAEIEKAQQPDWAEQRIAELEQKREKASDPQAISLYNSKIEQAKAPGAAEEWIRQLEI